MLIPMFILKFYTPSPPPPKYVNILEDTNPHIVTSSDFNYAKQQFNFD